LRLENGVPQATRTALADMGWAIGASDGGFGRYECVELTKPNGERVCRRQRDARDGCALAY
jgi:gamma-glutamyltranspeptidase/glutathione hydrolase